MKDTKNRPEVHPRANRLYPDRLTAGIGIYSSGLIVE